MKRIWTTQLTEHIGERVRLAGWLHRLRRLSGVSFLILRDGTGLAQIIVDDPALVAQLAALHNESVLVVEGRAVAEATILGVWISTKSSARSVRRKPSMEAEARRNRARWRGWRSASAAWSRTVGSCALSVGRKRSKGGGALAGERMSMAG